MKTHAYMDSQRWSNRNTFTEPNAKCILHLRKGDSIPLFIGRGRDGDRIGMIVPDIQEGYVVFIYESRYGDSFSFLCKNENEAKERLEAQIKSPTFDGGLVSASMVVESNLTLALNEKVDAGKFEELFMNAFSRIIQQNNWMIRDGWIIFEEA
jgi:hypothetical protein